MVDLGTGNNNKINWAMNDKQEFIDIVETVYRGARKGRGLVVSPKGKKTIFSSSSENQRFASLPCHSPCSSSSCRLFDKVPLLEATFTLIYYVLYHPAPFHVSLEIETENCHHLQLSPPPIVNSLFSQRCKVHFFCRTTRATLQRQDTECIIRFFFRGICDILRGMVHMVKSRDGELIIFFFSRERFNRKQEKKHVVRDTPLPHLQRHSQQLMMVVEVAIPS